MQNSPLARFLASYLFRSKMLGLWCIFALLFAVNYINVQFAVLLNKWNGRFFDALQAVNLAEIYSALFDFIPLVAGMIAFMVLSEYVKKRFLIKVRKDITFRFLDVWLDKGGSQYTMKVNGLEPDNPDQRITEDIQSLVSLALNLSLSFFESLVTLIAFSSLLWSLSGSITFWGITINGYMFWVAIIYVAISSVITHLIGKKLKNFHFDAQKEEANFRYDLIAARTHADAIAGANSEEFIKGNLIEQFQKVYSILKRLIKKERDLDFFTVGLGQVTHLAPIFFALPSFFAGTLKLGGLMQIKGAFIDVARSLAWFIFAYDSLAKIAATASRLNELLANLEKAKEIIQKDKRTLSNINSIAITKPLSPNHKNTINFEFNPGTLTLIIGPSGVGKSTLLKTISGFITNYEGKITLTSKTYLISQNAFIKRGSLLENLTWGVNASKEQLIHLLDEFSLSYLIDKLDETCDWEHTLSGGESARITLIRAILANPKILLIDEAFGALDEATALLSLDVLQKYLPLSALILVTHSPIFNTKATQIITME